MPEDSRDIIGYRRAIFGEESATGERRWCTVTMRPADGLRPGCSEAVLRIGSGRTP